MGLSSVDQLWVTPTNYLSQRRAAQLGKDWLVVPFGTQLGIARFSRIIVEDGAAVEHSFAREEVLRYLEELKTRLRPRCYDNLIVL